MSLTYDDALNYIYSFTNYEVKPEYRYAPDVIDPTRPARLLTLLGDPHLQYPSIHIAGTKGKGSVAAICASALRAAGLHTGLYTSPHLRLFEERIQVGGQPIAPADLAALVEGIQPAVAQIEEITTFEVVTALAFLHFARRGVDVAVVEVGLGGRLDATNMVQPLVSVITSLSYDHTHLLGETLEQIAAEKGGIIKPGVSVVTACQEPGPLAVLERIAADQGAPLTAICREWWYRQELAGLDGQCFRAGRAGQPGAAYRLPLLGEHQAHNGAVALAALDVVRRSGRFPTLNDDAIRQGFAQVDWPGRFQILQRRPVVVLDGAHNAASMHELCRTLDALFPDQHKLFVLGITADKDVTGIIQALLPTADRVIATGAEHPRAAAPAELRQRVEQLGGHPLESPSVPAAIQLALEMAGPQDVICVTGSLFVVGDALTAWQRRAVAAVETAVPS